MTHPEHLLADYVDGSLEATARAGVDAHLADCARCRGEVAQASAGRAALMSLPHVEAPDGVASEALREAAVGSKAEGPPRYARLLPVAAAAVLVALLAIALPKLGHDDSSLRAATGNVPAATDGSGEVASLPAGTPQDLAKVARPGARLETQDVDYDEAGLTTLANQTAAQWSGVALPSSARPLAAPGAMFAADSLAAKCVLTDFPVKPPSVLVRLIAATYQGDPAYVGVVLQGTQLGKPPDRVVVWLVRTDDCTLARFADVKI